MWENVLSGAFRLLYKVEFQCLEYVWNHENMFETGAVRAYEGSSKRQVRRHNRDIFSIFFNVKVCCLFSLESPYQGDSNEYTQHTIAKMKKEKNQTSEIIPNI